MTGPDNTFVVAGSGRSGTTWILDVLATASNYKTVFEPLHPDVSDISKKYAGKYIRPGEHQADIKEFMDAVISGKIRTIWTDYRVVSGRLKPTLGTFSSPRAFVELCHRYKALWNNYRILNRKKHMGVAVKFIRANLLLGWLCGQYKTKTLFIVRHPGAVIESKLRLDAAAVGAGLKYGASDWDPHVVLNQYLNDKAFYDDVAHSYTNQLDLETLSDLEIHTLNWCLENAPVLDIARKYNICVSCYEDLVANGETEWSRITDYLGLSLNYETLNINKPSQQASEDFRKLATIEEKLSRWMGRFTDTEKESIDKILKLFNVNVYSAFECMPSRIASGSIYEEISR